MRNDEGGPLGAAFPVLTTTSESPNDTAPIRHNTEGHHRCRTLETLTNVRRVASLRRDVRRLSRRLRRLEVALDAHLADHTEGTPDQ